MWYGIVIVSALFLPAVTRTKFILRIFPKLTCQSAIHAVDRTHNGSADSSVLYVPVCPTTEASARYVARQRDAFVRGIPAPDFPGGMGESEHIGRPDVDHVLRTCEPLGVQSMGLAKLVATDEDTVGGREAVERANKVWASK